MNLRNFFKDGDFTFAELVAIAETVADNLEDVDGYLARDKRRVSDWLVDYGSKAIPRDTTIQLVTAAHAIKPAANAWRADVHLALAYDVFWRGASPQQFIDDVMDSRLGSGVLDVYGELLQTNQANNPNRRRNVLRDLQARYNKNANFYRFTMHWAIQKGYPQEYREYWLRHTRKR